MTVRLEIAAQRRATGEQTPDAYSCSTWIVRGGARQPKACRSSGSTIIAEVFMNHAG